MRLALALLAAIAVSVPAAAAPAGPVVLDGRVAAVVDGDTIRVRTRGFETPVRLIGVDTPETRRPGTPVQCGGPQATARARALMPPGRRVRLVTDPTQDVRDRYARLLAYVYVPGRRVSVNLRLVAEGAGRAHVYDTSRPFLHVAAFRRAESRARRARRGIWGPPCRGDTDRPASSPAPGAVPAAGCDPHYTGACVPPGPSDVDCGQVRARVRVEGGDPHRLDGDGDGWGCERYG